MSSGDFKAQVSIGAEFTGQRAVDQAKGSFHGLNDEIKTLAKEGLAELAALFAVEKIAEFGKSTIELADQLGKLSQKTGISAQALSGLKEAAQLGDVSFEQLQVGLKKLSGNVADAGAGVSKSIEYFKALGITVKDTNGNLKPTDEILFQVADRFEHMPDGANKARLALALFGKSGTDLIPVLNEGREGLQKYNLALSDGFVAGSTHFNDGMKLMALNTRQFSVDVLEPALPALNAFVDELVKMGRTSNKSGDDFSLLAESIKIIASTAIVLGQALGGAFDTASLAVVETIQAVKLLIDELVDTQYLGEALENIILGKYSAASDSFKTYIATSKQDFQGFLGGTQSLGDDYNAKILSRAKQTADAISRIYGATEASPLEKRSGKGANLGGLNDGSESKHDQEAKALAKYLEEQKKEIEATTLQLDQGVMLDDQYKKRQIAIKANGDAAKATVGWESDTKRAYKEATDAIITQKQALVDLQEQQKESFGRGAQEGLKEYIESARNVAAQSKQLFTNMFSGMEDAVVQFVQTGKLSFASLANALEADLIRIAFRQTILFGAQNLIGSLFGGSAAGPIGTPSSGSSLIPSPTANFANGGIMTEHGAVPLRKYAGGGVASSPQLALFGEGARPEAYVPLPDGRNIPVKMDGANGGTSVVVNVSIDNKGESTDSNSSSQSGKALGQLIAASVKSAIVNEKRPGGLLA